MGKKNRNKHRSKKFAQEKKVLTPDDYFSSGPFEVARFGKINVLRSHMSHEEYEVMNSTLMEHYPEVCSEIDNLISQIAAIVKMLPPAQLMQRSFIYRLNIMMKKESDHVDDIENQLALRMLDYLQSMIASVSPDELQAEEIEDTQWEELKHLVNKLFIKINSEFLICNSALRRERDANYYAELEEYYIKAMLHWINVRGKRYLIHDIPFLQDFIGPHSDVIEELFGITSESLLQSLYHIQTSLLSGVNEALYDFEQFRNATMGKVKDKLRGNIEDEGLPRKVFQEVLDENEWNNWRDDVVGRLFGLNLFDLEKNTDIPPIMLDELSWEPGEDVEFYQEGEQRGWPTKVWPVFKRPFLKIKGRYYCFDLYSLFDNIYRALQKTIIKLKPSYTENWNTTQKELAETLPLAYFEKLLPGAKLYRSVYYRWLVGNNTVKDWCEADALISYGDHLFVVEVRAGAFCTLSPATHFDEYLESIKYLVLKPTTQGRRFIEYLNSADEVNIYNKDHIPIATISKDDYEYNTICAVTLDSITEIASQVEHLDRVGISVGSQPVWSFSIDDLRVYSELFSNPLVFLYYVEQRMNAFRSKLIQVDDEMIHLGLFLRHNDYVRYADRIMGEASELMWSGYHEDIERYFSKKMHNPDSELTELFDYPYRIEEIVDYLSLSNVHDRCRLSSLLLGHNLESQELISNSIEKMLLEQNRDRKIKPMSLYGEVNITIICYQPDVVRENHDSAIEFTKQVLMLNNESSRTLLELSYNSSDALIGVNFTIINQGDISESERERLSTQVDTLRETRISKAIKDKKKVGRNEDCPCGSGKKYKKCCMKL